MLTIHRAERADALIGPLAELSGERCRTPPKMLPLLYALLYLCPLRKRSQFETGSRKFLRLEKNIDYPGVESDWRGA